MYVCIIRLMNNEDENRLERERQVKAVIRKEDTNREREETGREWRVNEKKQTK